MLFLIIILSLILSACEKVDEKSYKNYANNTMSELEKKDSKLNINDLLIYSLAYQKNIDELFEIKELNTFLEKEQMNEKEIANLKNLITECHSIRGQKAICKRPLKEVFENGYLD